MVEGEINLEHQFPATLIYSSKTKIKQCSKNTKQLKNKTEIFFMKNIKL